MYVEDHLRKDGGSLNRQVVGVLCRTGYGVGQGER